MNGGNLVVRVTLTGRRGARYEFDLHGNGATLEQLLQSAKREGAAWMRDMGPDYDTVSVRPL